MQKTVKWGILGASKFAYEHMGPAIHMAKHAEFNALATSSPAKAAPFQALNPGLRIFSDYDALLDDPDIDAVYIPLPNHLHVEWTLKALEAGKHVLCEKPIALKAPEINQLIKARDETGLLAAEAYMIVHHPQWQRAKELVQNGAIGKLIHVDGAFSYDNRADPQNIRNQPNMGGGGIRDIGVYTYGSTQFVTGETEFVLQSHEYQTENGVDTFSHVAGRFPSFSYSAYVSMRMFPRQEMVFHGDAGVLRLTAPFNPLVFGQAELHLSSKVTTNTIERFPGINHYVLQVEAFGDSIQNNADYPWPLERSYEVQKMMDIVLEKIT